jgi:hypothetical protein
MKGGIFLTRGRKSNKGKEELLTESQVWDVIEFARNMSPYYNNVFTPDLVNQRMQDINMNPMSATQDLIDKALLNPKQNEDDLIGFSHSFELNDMMYKRMLYYLGNMLSFDLTYTCVNAESADYKSKDYKKDLIEVYDFLDRFDIKKEFKKVLRQLIRQEVFYCVLRDKATNICFKNCLKNIVK